MYRYMRSMLVWLDRAREGEYREGRGMLLSPVLSKEAQSASDWGLFGGEESDQ